MVKTNLIMYIFCAPTVYLQYLIPTCPTMFIYSSDIFQPQFLEIFMQFVVLLCAVYMSMYLVTVCIYDHHHYHKHQGLDQFDPFRLSPQLQLFSPTFLQSSNCSPSLWSVVV